jgi:hypothetical protein
MGVILVGAVVSVMLLWGPANRPNPVDSFEAVDTFRIELTGVDSISVFDLLTESHHVEYRSSALGVVVTGIDSIEAGGGSYWRYSVNDTVPQIAADRLFTRTGDRVIWFMARNP